MKCIPEIFTSNALLENIRQACVSAQAHIDLITKSVKEIQDKLDESVSIDLC